MAILINIVSAVLVTSGLVLFLGAAVGLLRFPDFYTRMHAAGKGDTLSSLLICAGLGLYVFKAAFDGDPEHHVGWGEVFTFLKILAICTFVMMTSPTSTHALMRAGYEEGVEPARQGRKAKRASKEDASR